MNIEDARIVGYGQTMPKDFIQRDTVREPTVEQRLQETLDYLGKAGGILDSILDSATAHEPQQQVPPAGIVMTAAVVCQRAAGLCGALDTLRERLGHL